MPSPAAAIRTASGRFAAGLVEATFALLVVPYVAFVFEAPALADARALG